MARPKRHQNAPCVVCGEQKPRTIEFYYADKQASDGTFAACKVCHLKRSAVNEKKAQRYRPEYNKQRWQKIKETARLRASPAFAKWREENRVKRLEWEANYRRTEKYRAANRINQENRRALKAGAEGMHTKEEFNAVLIAQAYRCFYCGVNITNNATEDHFIPLTRGGSDWIENIRAACRTCNTRKGNRVIGG